MKVAGSFETSTYLYQTAMFKIKFCFSVTKSTSFIASIIIMALQAFIGPLPLFQFLDPVLSRWNSLDGGSARRKSSIYT
jgi:hypothetical protein